MNHFKNDAFFPWFFCDDDFCSEQKENVQKFSLNYKLTYDETSILNLEYSDYI